MFENGLIEHEFDHVYMGISDAPPIPHESEVQNWRYESLNDIEQDINLHPGKYTEWLKVCLPEVKNYYNNTLKNKITENAQA